jgi:hypothetical protein
VTGSPIAGAGTIVLTPAGTSGGIPYFNSATSEASSAALTSNALVLGGGAGAAPKVAAGLSTDGTSKVNLGVAGTSVGSVAFSNATSGSITLSPVTGALGAVTLSLPAATATLATTANINTALPSATTSQIYVGTGAAGTAGTASLGTGLVLGSSTLTPNYQAGTLTTFGAGLTLASGTLTSGSQPITSTYTTSGTIALTDHASLLNCSTSCAMTLGSGSADGWVLWVKRYGSATDSVTATIDGVASTTINLNSPTVKDSIVLVWNATNSTWLIQ